MQMQKQRQKQRQWRIKNCGVSDQVQIRFSHGQADQIRYGRYWSWVEEWGQVESESVPISI